MSISIKFLGGVRTVTGSSHLIETTHSRVLIDCGLFYGRRDESYEQNTRFDFKPQKLDAVLLSHAHIDHCGNIPTLIGRGLRCKIYTTSATRDLCRLMLEDSGKVQAEDIRYVNKINRRAGQSMRKALYTQREGKRAIRKFRPLSYRQRFKVAKDIVCTFYDAAHILGSGVIVLDIKRRKQQSLRIGYAVDLGRKGLPLLNDPTIVEGMDYLILESTYGARHHSSLEDAKEKLCGAIKRTIERNGKVFIPSFALERAQEIIYFLNELIRDKKIPPIPIYVDSPLTTNITEVFRTHYGYFNEETREEMRSKKSGPFDSINLNYVRNINDSKALNYDRRPMIIIAGSGMCEAGRILHHLKNSISESINTIIVVGYMAQNTLGKRIVERERVVRIYGVECELNAEVVVINAFSRHADQNELSDYVEACRPLKRVFIVHGDVDQSQGIYERLSQNGVNVHMPEKGEAVRLDD